MLAATTFTYKNFKKKSNERLNTPSPSGSSSSPNPWSSNTPDNSSPPRPTRPLSPTGSDGSGDTIRPSNWNVKDAQYNIFNSDWD